MAGLGTIINVALIIAGGILGIFFGRYLNSRLENTLSSVCGVSVLFIAIAGALKGMLVIVDGKISTGQELLITLSLLVGALIGELLNIEDRFAALGEWLKVKTKSEGDFGFVDSFLTATFIVSIGAMAIVGPINDVLYHDYNILIIKGILDMIIVMVLTASYGKGALFSFVPVAIIQGLATVMAKLIQPILTDAALANISLVGSILIFCVGINLVWGKKIRVANLVPALLIAAVAAYF